MTSSISYKLTATKLYQMNENFQLSKPDYGAAQYANTIETDYPTKTLIIFTERVVTRILAIIFKF